MANLPYAVPPNYVIRLVEEGSLADGTVGTQEPVQPHPPPHPSYPHHFQFPPVSLHNLTLKAHYHGPHAPGSIRTSTSGNWAPATDIRETLRLYHIEIETAGTTDKDSLLIQWLSPHTLLVQGEIKRPGPLGLLDPSEGEKVWEGDDDGWAKETGHAKPDTTDGGPIERTPSRETVEAELRNDTKPTILLSERKVGPWRRTFTLPDDVEIRELKARLEGGLLRIDVPKRSVEAEEIQQHGGVRIEIQ
ncbi:hypothetical protein B0A52_04348 [Exophiala mesophila]|uniref:SHSP domain-containing protein n=1 Tax=Exophiala mesophila TaxID=212818 RepID=A0A438N8H7_EXOME|nr:hypothetical protein B0A52_04348 [Exophiala mesophila]